jgi:hypothetical protein
MLKPLVSLLIAGPLLSHFKIERERELREEISFHAEKILQKHLHEKSGHMKT